MASTELSPTEEDREWELEEGIPQPHEPVIQKYFEGRDALIAQEDKHRSGLWNFSPPLYIPSLTRSSSKDGSFRELLSPMAQEACSIVGQICFEEQHTVWKAEAQEEVTQRRGGEPFPGMMFSLAKDRMEQTKLWRIMRRMPKGALLHCHLEAMVDLDWLFREALTTECICISAQSGVLLQVDDGLDVGISFQCVKQPPGPDASIWTQSYTPSTWVPINKAADTFPHGGREGFISWLKSKCSITAEESLNHHHGVNAIWRKFISCFQGLRTLIYYEPLYRKFLAKMFKDLLYDEVYWVDVRIGFAFAYRRLGSEIPEDGYEEVVRVFDEEVKKFKASEDGKRFWGARIIWTTIRAFDKRDIVESMHQCVETKLAYPHLIAGFDLVGQEDPGPPLADLVPYLFHFRKLCAQAHVNIPFFFHAGETSTSGTAADQNLFDAIILGSRRIGHGFSLFKHPLLMNMARDRRVCIECCPVSNEVLRLTSSITSHPLPAMLAQGVPVCLCNDDPAILGQGSSGMSHDFWQALQGIESLGLEGLGSLAENSVRWAAFEDLDNKQWIEDVRSGAYGQGERAKRMKEWKKQWEAFVQWIVIEFGPDVDLDPEE